MKKIIFILLIISNTLLGAGLNALEKQNNINFLGKYEIGDIGLDDNGKVRQEVIAVRYKLAGKVLNEYNVNLELADIEKKVRNSIKDKAKQEKVLAVVREAYSYLGVRYKWGGNTKKEGVDCSGFVHNALLKGNIETRRVSRLQAKDSVPVKVADATIGDLIFFKTTNLDEVSHVGLYLGDKLFMHASSGYGKVVITRLKGFYKQTFSGFGRVF